VPTVPELIRLESKRDEASKYIYTRHESGKRPSESNVNEIRDRKQQRLTGGHIAVFLNSKLCASLQLKQANPLLFLKRNKSKLFFFWVFLNLSFISST
jgi:hypothetical protein